MKVVSRLQYGLPWVTTEFAFILSSKLTTYKIKGILFYILFLQHEEKMSQSYYKKRKKNCYKT